MRCVPPLMPKPPACVVLAALLVAPAPVGLHAADGAARYRLACVNANSGELLWKTAQADFPRPHVEMRGNAVTVLAEGGTDVLARLRLDTGAPLPASTDEDGEPGPTFHRVAELTRPMQLGPDFVLGPPGSRVVTARARDAVVTLATLEAPTLAGAAVNGVAVVVMDGRAGLGLEVVAVEARTRALLWALDLRRRLPDLDEERPSTLAVDGGDVLLAVDGGLTRVDAATGRVLWTALLPRNAAPWRITGAPRVGRDGDRYVVSFGDVLMVVAHADGKVRATYVGGLGSAPWPVVVEDRLLVTWTDAHVPPEVPRAAQKNTRPNIVVISRDPRWLGGYRADFLRRRDVAPREQVQSPLASPPPAQTDQAGNRLTLHLVEPPAEGNTSLRMDVTEALQRRGRVMVRLSPQVEKVLLLEGSRQVFSGQRPP